MVRISGVDLSDKLLVPQALTALYGIGRRNAYAVLEKAKVEVTKRVHQLNEEEVKNIQKVIDADYVVEGDLQRQVGDNIKRLRVIGTYRGKRHMAGLPVRGQRTRVNARTRRGKRKTVGAMKKEDRTKIEQADKNKQ